MTTRADERATLESDASVLLRALDSTEPIVGDTDAAAPPSQMWQPAKH
jgi:hypothetical protein